MSSLFLTQHTLAAPGKQQRSAQQIRIAAIVMICAATACFSLLDTSTKFLSTRAHVPLFQVIWLRFVSHALLTFLVLGPKPFGAAVRSKKPAHQILRSIFMLGSTAFNVWALQYLQLDQAATISFLSPLIVAALAGPMLGEWIGWRRFLAICTGFSGVLFVTRPGFGGIHWAVWLSFCATLSYALYGLWTRYLARFDPAKTTQIFSPVAGAVLMAPFALWDWQTPQSFWVCFLLFSTGITGGLGHWLLILAYERAPAPIIAPFGYINIIFMVAWGYLVFSDVPGWWTLAGAGVIISSGVYLLLRERQTGSSAPASSATVVEG